jgi:hypothetical protein
MAANFPSSSASILPMSPCIRGGWWVLVPIHFSDKNIGGFAPELELKLGQQKPGDQRQFPSPQTAKAAAGARGYGRGAAL